MMRVSTGIGNDCYISSGSAGAELTAAEISTLLDGMLTAIANRYGRLRRVLLVPPDITRLDSGAGELTVMLYRKLVSTAHVEVMPALGTHLPMTTLEIARMYPGIPQELFRIHRWRHDVVEMGEVPGSLVAELTDGRLDFPIRCAVNRILTDPRWDRIISVGQLVPHELAGIANYTKNILIGLGGPDAISRSHYVASVFGTERLMGEVDNPMRSILSYMERHCIGKLPITYVMTVRGSQDGRTVTRGLFAGDDERAYNAGAALCRQVSIHNLDRPTPKIVCYMDPTEYRTTWVANKAIYRTRMAVADDGELLVLAPGVAQFGEDGETDAFIRRVGYRNTGEMVDLVARDSVAEANLTAVAHIIISSPEGRFRLRYAAGGLSKEEMESVRLTYADPLDMFARYDPRVLSDGWNTMPDGEEIYFVPRPAGGLWKAMR
jgi:nickel-dependent lactate racemase